MRELISLCGSLRVQRSLKFADSTLSIVCYQETQFFSCCWLWNFSSFTGARCCSPARTLHFQFFFTFLMFESDDWCHFDCMLIRLHANSIDPMRSRSFLYAFSYCRLNLWNCRKPIHPFRILDITQTSNRFSNFFFLFPFHSLWIVCTILFGWLLFFVANARPKESIWFCELENN